MTDPAAPAPAAVASAAELRRFTAQALEQAGASAEEAALAARPIVQADLFGYDTHGVRKLLFAVEDLRAGRVTGKAEFKIVRDSPVAATVDGGNGLGMVVAERSMRLALAKARAGGVGLVSARNSNTFGAALCYAMLALEHNLIGACATNFVVPYVVPPGGREPKFNTNPFAFAVPAKEEPPLLFDMSTSVVAGGKVRLYRLSGRTLPWGWGLDREGRITRDPTRQEFVPPLGSTPELGAHKGYGLALLVDVFSGLLSGGVYGDLAVRRGQSEPEMLKGNTAAHFFAALDPALFRDPAEFRAEMDEMSRALRASAPAADAAGPVRVPGARAVAEAARREREGVPLDAETVENLRAVAKQLGLAPPELRG